MSLKLKSLAGIFGLAFWAVGQNAFAQAEPIYVSDVGFATPESVEYNAADDVYLVANINGNPFDKDDNGFISKVSPDGTVLDLKWIDGANAQVNLNAPKGMQILGNRLYIADIDTVRVFELPSGKQLKDINIKGSTFLNGVSKADDNSVYVTDSGLAPGFTGSGADAIYKVSVNGKVIPIVKGVQLGKPNGVAAHDGGIIMGTFGSGKLVFMDAKGQTKAQMTLPGGRLDGLLSLDDGSIITSSWEAEAVFHISPNKAVKTLMDGLEAPADLGLDTQRNRVLIPMFKANEVVILPLN
ncbi:hypothetical protein [Thiosulfativibrio zosterae]|uniref:ATP-binding protein n=1 Tax=Thiosulfativibrio zosterae TaxID=2675053 RepID=A0A6F8PJJ9_9GAMM|nr:hypothetical protein [Thiosulfativibrio zosterae]BBP42272.1 ATP-binding protein [Thiosulfativibrio zosterae]